MIFKFTETQRARTRASLLHTAFGSGLNRSARRHLSRLADKFTPNAAEIHLKVSEAQDIARILAAYRGYLAAQKLEGEEAEKAVQAQAELVEVENGLTA